MTGFAVTKPEDILRGMKQYPTLKVWEMCPECGEEVEIKAYGRSFCPHCWKPILPCAMCARCVSPCVYESVYGRVTTEPHFYTLRKVGKRIIAFQGADYCEGLDGWDLYIYPSTATIDPDDYRKRGADAFEYEGYPEIRQLSEEEAWDDYSSRLLECKYMPLQNVTDHTPPGRYWMSFLDPFYQGNHSGGY